MELLQAIGLSAPAGLNAYLTLLLVGLAGRFGWVDLTGTWGERLMNPYVLAGLAVLTVWEIAVDKIPGADHLNDVAGTVIRPLSGAIIMLVTPNELSETNPALALGTGALFAGGLHALKAMLRPLINVGTLGMGAPVASAAEDTAAVGTIAVALIAPALIAILLLLAALLAWWAFGRLRRLRGGRRGGRMGDAI